MVSSPDNSNRTITCSIAMLRAHLPEFHILALLCTPVPPRLAADSKVKIFYYIFTMHIFYKAYIQIDICVDERKRATSHLVELANDGGIIPYIHIYIHINYTLCTFRLFLNFANLTKICCANKLFVALKVKCCLTLTPTPLVLTAKFIFFFFVFSRMCFFFF